VLIKKLSQFLKFEAAGGILLFFAAFFVVMKFVVD